MEIKKADSKGRVTVAEKGRYYQVEYSSDSAIRMIPLEEQISPLTNNSYESGDVSDAKDAVWDVLDDLEQNGEIDAEVTDTIALADRIVTTLIRAGWAPKS